MNHASGGSPPAVCNECRRRFVFSLRFHLVSAVAVCAQCNNDAVGNHFAQKCPDACWLQIKQLAELCASCTHMIGQISDNHVLFRCGFDCRIFISTFLSALFISGRDTVMRFGLNDCDNVGSNFSFSAKEKSPGCCENRASSGFSFYRARKRFPISEAVYRVVYPFFPSNSTRNGTRITAIQYTLF